MTDQRKRPPVRAPRREGQAELDARLVEMLARRAEALALSARSRKAKGGSLADAETERHAWKSWSALASRLGLDLPILRRIFILANGLGYELAGQDPGSPPRRLTFRPLARPVDITLDGPLSVLAIRAALFLSAGLGQPLDLSPVVLADPLVEFVKAANAATGKVAWEGERLRGEAGGALDFNGKAVFAGDDEQNLYFLLALALPTPGRATFTGGSRLKSLDLGPAAAALKLLGARLTGLEPMSWGLPARLETPGLMDSGLRQGETITRAVLPPETPPGLALALALAAPAYPQGLVLEWPEHPALDRALRQAESLLAALGGVAARSGRSLAVKPGLPGWNPSPSLPLDPLLCAYLLAAPRLSGGRLVLRGAWPRQGPGAVAATEAAALLLACGVTVRPAPGGVESLAGALPERPVLDAFGRAELAPLACVLALASPRGALLRLPEETLVEAQEFLAALGRGARLDEEGLELSPAEPGAAAKPPSLACSSPWWGLALGLASFRAPGATLANPGVLAELWPAFPRLFAESFSGRAAHSKESDRERKPVKRRIKL